MVDQSAHSLASEHFVLFFTFGALALVINWVAKLVGFFKRPCQKVPPIFLTGAQASVFFALFLFVYFIITPLIVGFALSHAGNTHPANAMTPTLVTILQLIIYGIMILFFTLYAFTQPRKIMLGLWKQPILNCSKPIWFDIGLGALTWIISIGVVVSIDQLFEFFNVILFDFRPVDQVAVSFLKSAMETPLSKVLAILSIVVFAPIIEEFIFRGVLMSWLYRRFSLRISIMISSLAFAFFHFSSVHSLSNITLIASLFTLACYLGFLYERQRSLFAPITLHVTFNLISVIRILATS